MLAAGKVNNMEKGYLNIKQLESMKKADLQELANKLGVSDNGTVKQLAARIAEVEVDIPEESQPEKEEKPPAEQPKAAGEPEETEEDKTEEGKAAGENKEPKPPEEPAEQKELETGKARVKAVTRYLDKQLNQIKEAGEVLTVGEERAAELVAAKVAEIVK